MKGKISGEDDGELCCDGRSFTLPISRYFVKVRKIMSFFPFSTDLFPPQKAAVAPAPHWRERKATQGKHSMDRSIDGLINV